MKAIKGQGPVLLLLSELPQPQFANISIYFLPTQFPLCIQGLTPPRARPSHYKLAAFPPHCIFCSSEAWEEMKNTGMLCCFHLRGLRNGREFRRFSQPEVWGKYSMSVSFFHLFQASHLIAVCIMSCVCRKYLKFLNFFTAKCNRVNHERNRNFSTYIPDEFINTEHKKGAPPLRFSDHSVYSSLRVTGLMIHNKSLAQEKL